MSDTNFIIDQIENKVNELIKFVKDNDRHFNNAVNFRNFLRDDFDNFKYEEYDTRTDEEIAADAHGSRMCDKSHAKKDN